jgi:membrane protein/epoxyqueuosine reductase
MTSKIENAPETAPITETRPARGLGYYLRGGWLFFKKMWPALYDLSTSEVYVFASAIAFNALLSFFSFLVLVGNFLVNVVGWQRGYETVYRLMMAFVPVESKLLFESLDLATRRPSGKASLVSVALLIFSSSGAFLPLEIALNRAWGFKGPRGMVKQQLTYLPLVVVCGAIILCCVALASVWDYTLGGLFGNAPIRKIAFNFISPIIALPFIVLIFFVVYYWVPNGKVQANQIFFTSVATSILWVMTTFIYQLLIPVLNFRGSYGPLFTVMSVIIWIFISSFILILGANLSAREVLPRAWTGRLALHPGRRRESLQ